MSKKDKNGWEENRKLICSDLDRHGKTLEKILVEIGTIKIEITKLQMKAGIWGLLGGLIPVLVMILILVVKSLL